MINKVAIQISFTILCQCNGSNFLRYTSSQIINTFKPFVEYTHTKASSSKFGSEDSFLWKRTNRNIHSAIKYAKLKSDKALYIGWVPLNDADVLNAYGFPESDVDINYNDCNLPLLFIIFNIESTNQLSISQIIPNPCLNSIHVDLRILKAHMRDITNQTGIHIDISNLKTYNGGRWYWNFIHMDIESI